MVICLGRDADAYGPADATASHCLLLQVGFTLWYWLTRVVPDNGPFKACVCVCCTFTAESDSERVLKIGYYLGKLWARV